VNSLAYPLHNSTLQGEILQHDFARDGLDQLLPICHLSELPVWRITDDTRDLMPPREVVSNHSWRLEVETSVSPQKLAKRHARAPHAFAKQGQSFPWHLQAYQCQAHAASMQERLVVEPFHSGIELDALAPSRHESDVATTAASHELGSALINLFETDISQARWQEWLQLYDIDGVPRSGEVTSQDVGNAFINLYDTNVSDPRWQEWLQLAGWGASPALEQDAANLAHRDQVVSLSAHM
jgi:hypothetical protein